jgi:hypothetical protein
MTYNNAVGGKGVEMIKVETFPDGRMDTLNAAAYTGRSVKTMAQWRWLEIGPRYVKMGRIYYFKSDIDEWLAKGLKEPQQKSEGCTE